MSDKTLQVEVVAADRLVWSGSATMVQARTAEGDIGVLADHAPVLSVLLACAVEITEQGGSSIFAAVGDGFLSVANNRVSILADRAELGTNINRAAAQSELEALQASEAEETTEAAAARRLAQARVDAAAKAS
jgi:F-type H+-transporting ATPase subunit epsilon